MTVSIRRIAILACTLSLVLGHASPTIAAPTISLVTCVNLESGKERISKDGSCLSTYAVAKWRLAQSDTAIASGPASKQLTVCSNQKNSASEYRLIRTACSRHQVKSLYTRSAALPAAPVIANVASYSDQSASISLLSNPASNPDAPVAFYTVTSSKGKTQKIYSWRDLTLAINGLEASTTYTFTVTATTADGTSPVSITSQALTTKAYVAPTTPTPTARTAPLATPAFTLSLDSETKTAGTSITGYSVTSTGGAISSFAISPSAPAGTTFDDSTGILSGTPTTVQSATPYTITATNASGSATRSFTLTVIAVVYTVGSTGPGGGYIYYVNDSGFNCGTEYTNNGSPTGDLCHYLEVAPLGWAASPSYPWASPSKSSTQVSGLTNRGTAYNNIGGVGLGFLNSQLISTFDRDSLVVAATAARYYRGGGKNDWYLPTSAELNLLCQWARGIASSVTTRCSGGTLNSATYGASSAGFLDAAYWASEADTTTPNRMAYVQTFGTPHPMFGSQYQYSKDSNALVRPIRAF